jgi:hypothetical protein
LEFHELFEKLGFFRILEEFFGFYDYDGYDGWYMYGISGIYEFFGVWQPRQHRTAHLDSKLGFIRIFESF